LPDSEEKKQRKATDYRGAAAEVAAAVFRGL